MPAHGVVPVFLVHFIGRLFFRSSRVFPPFFGAVALCGVGVGVFLVCLTDDPKPYPNWQVRGLGVLCVLFYGGLLAMMIVKLRRKTWDAFCRMAEEQFP